MCTRGRLCSRYPTPNIKHTREASTYLGVGAKVGEGHVCRVLYVEPNLHNGGCFTDKVLRSRGTLSEQKTLARRHVIGEREAREK